MTKKKTAFTLIELSIVILIIGILAIGVSKGISLVMSSKVTLARSLTAKSGIVAINGLVSWHETSMQESFYRAGLANGSIIANWSDISSNQNKNNLTRASNVLGVSYLQSGINDIPSILFESGRLSLSAFYQSALAESSIFIVFEPYVLPSSGYSVLLDQSSAPISTNTNFSIGFNESGFRISFANGSNVLIPQTFKAYTPYAISVYSAGAKSKIFLNDAVNVVGGSEISAGTNRLFGLTIGNARAGGSQFNGAISEIIIYSRALTSSERKSVMSYLKRKYNINIKGV